MTPRSPALAVVAVLLLAVVGGGAGVVVYLRRQPGHAIAATTPTSVANPPAGSATEVGTQASVAPALASASAPPVAPASAPPVAPAVAPSAAAAPSATASSAASTAPSELASDLPPGMGRVRTAGAAPGRRIFVDERVAGQTPEAIVVKCGVRTVKVGSSGVARSVDVPCGGEITVGDR